MPFHVDQKQVLCDSLVSLVQETALDRITVQDIVDKCGVTRTTFYRYFKDKYELLSYAFSNEADCLAQKCHMRGSTFYDFAVEVCLMMIEREGFFKRAFAYEGQNSFFGSVCGICRDAVAEHLINSDYGDDLADQSIFQYYTLGYAAATAAVFRQWVMNGMNESPDVIASIICDACPECFRDYLI